MANVKISELPVAGSVSGTDMVPITQGATTRSATVDQLRSAVPYGNLVYSGLTAGHVLKATGAAAASFSALSSADLSDFNEAAQDAIGAMVANSSNVSLTYVDGTPSLTADLVNTAVTPASYGSATQVATFTVDAKGRLTAASNTAISITSAAVSDFNEAAQDAIGAMVVNSSNVSLVYVDGTPSLTADLVDTTVTPGSYGSTSQVATFTVDAKGRLTAAASTAISITSAAVTDFNEAAQDAIGAMVANSSNVSLTYVDGTPSLTADLVNTAVTPASYGSASQVATFTVDAKGRLTAAANTDISITSSAVTDFTEAAQDAIGAMVANSSNVSLTYVDGTPSLTADLVNTAVTPGSYGSATQVATFTVDAKGRLTAASNTSIALTNYSVQASASATTTSTTYVLCDSLSVTTPAAGTYLVIFNAQHENSTNGALRTTFALYKNGALVTHGERGYGVSGGAMLDANISMLISVSGSEDVAIYWKVAAGTGTIYGRSLSLVRIGP